MKCLRKDKAYCASGFVDSDKRTEQEILEGRDPPPLAVTSNDHGNIHPQGPLTLLKPSANASPWVIAFTSHNDIWGGGGIRVTEMETGACAEFRFDINPLHPCYIAPCITKRAKNIRTEFGMSLTAFFAAPGQPALMVTQHSSRLRLEQQVNEGGCGVGYIDQGGLAIVTLPSVKTITEGLAKSKANKAPNLCHMFPASQNASVACKFNNLNASNCPKYFCEPCNGYKGWLGDNRPPWWGFSTNGTCSSQCGFWRKRHPCNPKTSSGAWRPTHVRLGFCDSEPVKYTWNCSSTWNAKKCTKVNPEKPWDKAQNCTNECNILSVNSKLKLFEAPLHGRQEQRLHRLKGQKMAWKCTTTWDALIKQCVAGVTLSTYSYKHKGLIGEPGGNCHSPVAYPEMKDGKSTGSWTALVLYTRDFQTPSERGGVLRVSLSGADQGRTTAAATKYTNAKEERVLKNGQESVMVNVVVSPSSDVAYFINRKNALISLTLGGKNQGLMQIASSIPVVGGAVALSLAMVDRTRIFYLTASKIRSLDITPTIRCTEQDSRFLTQGLEKFKVTKAGQAEVYQVYAKGVRLEASKRVWSFMGYRKVSPKQTFGDFHFTKSVVCFRPCRNTAAEGECTPKEQYGDMKCCVNKNQRPGEPEVASRAELVYAKGAKRVPVEDLGRTDGMIVF